MINVNKYPGFYVVLDGIIGCGKSTQVGLFKEKFPDWVFARESGGTGFGEKMRDAVQGINNNYEIKIDPMAALMAYSASRAQLARKVIIPELQNGNTVLSDRYWHSGVYQTEGGVTMAEVITIGQIATARLMPDAVLHYDLIPEIGMARKAGAEDLDRYDMKELNFHRGVRRRYLEMAERYPDICHIIDASNSPEEVFATSVQILKERGII